MPAGTWNLGRLRKRVDYTGIKDLSTIQIRDTSPFSDQFFNITDFPTVLTGGKNLFKIKASANILVPKSKIHIEVLDSNGNPIYYEPINYLEQDGTRVIAIYVYPDTPFGVSTIYVAGRARVNPNTGQILRSSQNVNDRDYLNYPNVLWQRTVTTAPDRFNSTEIIFTQQPTIQIREVVQPYLVDTDYINLATASFGTGTYTIRPTPQQVSTTTTTTSVLSSVSTVVAGGYSKAVNQGQFKAGTPKNSSFAVLATPNPLAVSLAGNNNALNAFAGELSDAVLTAQEVSNTTKTSTQQQIIYAINESEMETSDPFFTADMLNGVVVVRNPRITPNAAAGVSVNNQYVPASQPNEITLTPGGSPDERELSGSYAFVINQVVNTTKARITLLPQNTISGTPGFKNAADSNTGGKFEVTLTAPAVKQAGGVLIPLNPQPNTQTVDKSESELNTNFTCSFVIAGTTTVTSEQSQSFAEIKLANIEPATGDVYKIKTFFKPGGAFGDFQDLGETVVERIEILEDTSSLVQQFPQGTSYNRIGFFTSLADFNQYFTASNAGNASASVAPTNPLIPSFEPDDLISGIRLTPSSAYTSNATFGYIHLKNLYRPRLVANTQYVLSLNCFADSSNVSSDPVISEPERPQLDIYVSGSNPGSVILSDDLTLNGFTTINFSDYEQSLQNQPGQADFRDGGSFGTRIGSIQLIDSGSLTSAAFRFQNGIFDQDVNIFFVQRSGRFNLADVSLKTFNETKFTPNFTRLNKRVPSEFMSIPLTFKIQFFDFLNNQAEAEALIFPVVFTGDNFTMQGGNNVIPGTVYFGNQIGTGIEASGQSSGYLRSVGYESFNSASRTDRPGGFLIFSGSIFTSSTDEYTTGGVGLEIVENSSSFFKFRTHGSDPGLQVKTPKFFFGDKNVGNFISGSSGNIEISSSGFHVDRFGFVTATNFAERSVTVTAANSSSFFQESVGHGGISGSTLLFDGSGGGPITMNMVLTVAPYHSGSGTVPIVGVQLPNSDAATMADVTIVPAANGITMVGGSGLGIGNFDPNNANKFGLGTTVNLTNGQHYTFSNIGGANQNILSAASDQNVALIAGIGAPLSASYAITASFALNGGGGGSADNLGNHTATQDLNMSNFHIQNVREISGSVVERDRELGILGNVTVDGRFRALGSELTIESGSITLTGDISGSVTSTGSFAHIITQGNTIEFQEGGSTIGRLKVDDSTGFSFDLADSSDRKAVRLGALDGKSATFAGHVTASRIDAVDTDNAASIRVMDADGNAVAALARVGSGANAHRGRLVLRDNANIKLELTTNGTSYINGVSYGLVLGRDSISSNIKLETVGNISGSCYLGNNIGDIYKNRIYIKATDFMCGNPENADLRLSNNGASVTDVNNAATRTRTYAASYIIPECYNAFGVHLKGQSSLDTYDVFTGEVGSNSTTQVVTRASMNAPAAMSAKQGGDGATIIVVWTSRGGTACYGGEIFLANNP